MSRDLEKRLDPLASLMLSVALMGNGFFIKRLVDEVDRTKQCIISQHEKIEDLQDQVATINARLRIALKQIPAKRKKPTVE